MQQPPHPLESRAIPGRVIFVRQRFSPFGGAELILDRTMTGICARGVRVALLGRSWSGRDDIEFIRCDPPRFPRFLRERRFAAAARARLAQEKDAIVQSHERVPGCTVFRAGDGAHAAYLEHRTRGMSRLMRAFYWRHPFHRSILALEREMFASPSLEAVIAISPMVADDIVRHFGFPRERIHLISNGIDLARFHPAARERHRAETRARMGVDTGRPVVLFVGSGYKRKGLDRAIAALAASGTGAELWVLGHDRHPAAYPPLAARAGLDPARFRLIGPVTDPLPYYAAADVLMLPALYEPFGSVTIEALACGLPVVTSTGCGARELVARLDPALVRDALDVVGFAEALRRALDLAAQAGTAGRARALAESYGIEPMIDRMLDIYRRLAA